MSTASTSPKSGKDLLAQIQATRKRGRTQICLRPDLVDAWAAANEALAEMVTERTSRLAGQGAKSPKKETDQARKVQEIEDQIDSASMWFEMESLDPDRWNEIADDHPPRPGIQVDQFLGHNVDAVIDVAIRRSTFDPVFEDCVKDDCNHEECGTWEALRKKVSPEEWAELRRLCREVNGRLVQPPKSPLASSILARRSSGSRRQPASQ